MPPLRFDHALLATTLLVAMSLSVRADPQRDVRQAADELNAWLGHQSNGDRWRSYLDWQQLQQQLRRGADADPRAIAGILKRFRQDAPGLELPLFEAVRHALVAWHTQLIATFAGDLSALTSDYRDVFRPVTPRRVAAARQRLERAIVALDDWLGDDKTYREGWHKYLQWSTLQSQLVDRQEVDAKSLRALAQPYRRLRSNQTGLELPVFTDLAAALEHYTNLASMSLARDQQRVYEVRIDELSELLSKYEVAPTTEARFAIGQRLGWLDGIEQSPELTAAVRAVLSRPNLYVDVSSGTISHVASRPIRETRPVRELILGTHIRGTALTSGRLDVRLLPSEASARFALDVVGAIEGRTRGYHPPVRIRSSSYTRYTAGKTVEFDGAAIVSQPTWARAQTSSRIHSIRKMGGPFLHRMVERVAWKRAQQQRGRASRIASRKAERRIIRGFDEQVGTAISKAQARYRDSMTLPLRRRGEVPVLHVSSGSDAVKVAYLQANRSQLGAPKEPPRLAEQADLRVRIHESIVDHFLNMLVGGRTLSRESLEKAATRRRIDAEGLFAEMDRPPPRPQEDDEPPPWSITLRSGRPITMRFHDQRVTFTIHGIRYVAGERRLKAWDIAVTYELGYEGSSIVLHRDGPAEILPAGFDPARQKLSQAQSGLRNLIMQRIERERAFPSWLKTKPLRLPGPTGPGQPLPIAAVSSQGGWLTVAWMLP